MSLNQKGKEIPMKFSATCFVFLLILFASLQPTFAFIGVGPRVGYYEAKEADAGRYFIGAAARIGILGLGAEAAIDYRSEKYDNGLLTVRSWPVTVSLIYHPLPVIYALAGAGWYHTTMDYNEKKLGYKIKSQTSTEMGYHVGVGVELPLGFTSKIAADVRYVFLNYDLGNTAGMENKDADFYSINITLFWDLF